MRVLVGCDDELRRASVRGSLEAGGDVEVVADLPQGSVHVAVLVHDPDVVLLVLPDGGHGLGLVTELASSCPRTVVVLLCASYADADLIGLLQAGVRGCLLEGIAAPALLATLRSAAHGEVALPRHLVATVVAELQRRPTTYGPPRSRADLLTPREREVLALLRLGLTTRQIAERLFVSDVTVRTHAAAVQRKLGVRSREQAVACGAGDIPGVEGQLIAHAAERPIQDRRDRTEHG